MNQRSLVCLCIRQLFTDRFIRSLPVILLHRARPPLKQQLNLFINDYVYKHCASSATMQSAVCFALMSLTLAAATQQLTFDPSVKFNGKFYELSQRILVCNSQTIPAESYALYRVGLSDMNGYKVDPDYGTVVYYNCDDCIHLDFSLSNTNHRGTYKIGLWDPKNAVAISLSPPFSILPTPMKLQSVSSVLTPPCGYFFTIVLKKITLQGDPKDTLFLEAFLGNTPSPTYDQSVSIVGWNANNNFPSAVFTVYVNSFMYSQPPGVYTNFNVYYQPATVVSSVKVLLGAVSFSRPAYTNCEWSLAVAY